MTLGRWRRGLVCAGALVMACGPEGQVQLDTESDTESGTETDPTAASNATTAPPQMTTGSLTTASMSDTNVTTGDPDDSGPVLDTSDGDGPPATETGDCPYGTEGCLCDVGSTCDEGLQCVDGTCVARPACRPIDTDPHDDETSAVQLAALDCGGSEDLGVIATLEGVQVDWFTFAATAAFGCPEQPAATVTTEIATDVCVFIECLQGNATNLDCAPGTMAVDSPDGRPGCCGPGQTEISDYDCSGFNSSKNVSVWISVGSMDEVCADYELSYAF